MSKRKRPEIDVRQLMELRSKLDTGTFSSADLEQIRELLDLLLQLNERCKESDVSIQRLLGMLFGSGTEKTDLVLGRKPPGSKDKRGKAKVRAKGHGRLAAEDYPGAQKVEVPHEVYKPGDPCPACPSGKLYDTQRPALIVRIFARALFNAMLYSMQVLRCNACGKTFTAKQPPEAGQEKYDPNVAPMLAVMRYGFGMPMNRLADMQKMLGIPMPCTTQWELLSLLYNGVGVVIMRTLLAEAAGVSLFHNDDTTARILGLEKEIREELEKATEKDDVRTGIFTTAIIAKRDDGIQISLFFTGRRHAGENLQAVLELRAKELPQPLQMCDGLSRNEPESATLKCNCNAHGRREFVDINRHFPEECAYVLGVFREVYKNEAEAKAQGLSAEQRMLYHQQHSKEPLDNMKLWMEEKFEKKLVEPNSVLGKAIKYILKRWDKLTRFLTVPGVPLDNNICERAIKTPIRHRDNSLFYKTENGAYAGDFYMTVIHTCRLCGADPFHYLTALATYTAEVLKNPAAWMPWNYKAAMPAAGPP